MLDRSWPDFDRRRKAGSARLCGNNCQLTVNTFADGLHSSAVTAVTNPITGKADDGAWNLYAYKREADFGLQACPRAGEERSGCLCLNF